MKIMESYLIAFALMNACQRSTTDIFTVIFFVVVYFLLKQKKKSRQIKDLEAGRIQIKKDKWISIICAVIFTAFYTLGNKEALSGGLTNKAFLTFYMGCTVIGLFCLFYEGVLWILENSTRMCILEEKKEFSCKMFWWMTGIVFLCMLPFLLTNFPAVMTPDSLSQYRQAAGIEGYNDHHPWMHTMILNLFYEIGYLLTKNIYAGIAFYTVAQMLLVAMSVSYVWSTLYEMGLKKKYCISGLALFVIYPYNLIYGVTIWKDILFSMAVLILTITLFRISEFVKLEKKIAKRDWILYAFSGFLMCVLRHNGFYAFLVMAPILIVLGCLYDSYKKKKYMVQNNAGQDGEKDVQKKIIAQKADVYKGHWKPFSIITIGILVLCFMIKGPIMDAYDVEPGKFAYKVCVPLQQIGRVVYDGCELTQEETEALEKINVLSYVKENYQKGGADPMFAWVIYGNQEYLEENVWDYCKLWISIGFRYPGEYVQAFLDLTKGYWYPMNPEQVVYFGITNNENGLIAQPILKGPVVVKIHELLTKLYTIFPLYGMLYSMGGMLWLFILLIGIAIRNGNHSMWIAGIPVLLLTLTLFIAVPLVADVRYGYPMLLTIPCVVAITFWGNKNVDKPEAA